jgi:stage III sporulation protein SpoIIIAA
MMVVVVLVVVVVIVAAVMTRCQKASLYISNYKIAMSDLKYVLKKLSETSLFAIV